MCVCVCVCERERERERERGIEEEDRVVMSVSIHNSVIGREVRRVQHPFCTEVAGCKFTAP